MWVLSVELLLNAFPHWLHLWGFSCTGGQEARQGDCGESRWGTAASHIPPAPHLPGCG